MLDDRQIANGGYKIYPHIVDDKKIHPQDKFTPLYQNSKNIRIVKMLCLDQQRGNGYFI